MKLYIKKIVIEKNGKIIERHNFGETVDLARGTEVYHIIKFLLGIYEPVKSPHNIRFFAIVEAEHTYCVRGRKDKGESDFTASIYKENEDTNLAEEYFNLVRQNPELDSVLFFNRFKSQDFPHKLLKYKDLLKYYPNGDFGALTNGYGPTRSFRGFISNYIKHYKPLRLRENKEMYLKLSQDGEFRVGRLDNDEDVYLSESENILYHYLSFISIADFWTRAEKIRNLNCVTKPLVVLNFIEFLDESIRISDIMHLSKKSGRQIILFVDK